jgi:hypothetical protein
MQNLNQLNGKIVNANAWTAVEDNYMAFCLIVMT